ncbi:MAG TPA: hypothetical protein VHV30_08035 [Polyangiaceae bacterium]|nr:hypothetical protein [Polyangiaceae bacterium]
MSWAFRVLADGGATRRAYRGGLLALAVVFLSACASSPADSNDGPLPTCPAREAPKDAPPPLGQGYSYNALPSGACDSSEPKCSLAVFGPCFGHGEYVGYPLSEYDCECNGGAWACVNAAPGGGICGDDADAGDASDESDESDASDAGD